MRKAIELGIPVLHHAWHKTVDKKPDVSDPREPADLARHLETEKIDRTLVSSCESVSYPDPHLGNEELFRRLEDLPKLLPVPVVNPALGSGRDLLERTRRLGARALALLPSYYGYSLHGSDVALFMDAWRERLFGLEKRDTS